MIPSGGDSQLVGHHLGQRRLDPLPHRGHARVDDDVAGGVHLDARVLPRPEPGLLQDAADPDPHVAPVAARGRLLGAQRRVVDGVEGLIEGRAIVAAVVDRPLAERRPPDVVRHLRGRDEVAAAQLEGIDPELRGRDVEQTFPDERALEAAGTAVGPGRRLVGEHALGLGRVVRDPVGPGHQGRRQLGDDDPVGADVGAEVHREPVDEGHDPIVGVESDLDLVVLLPRVVGGHEVLAAILDPLHGPAESHGRPRDHEILRVELAAHAEAAAYLQLDEVDQVLGMAEEVGEDAPVEVRHLGHAPQAQHTGAGVVGGGQPPRLQGHAGVALDGEALAHTVGAAARAARASPRWSPAGRRCCRRSTAWSTGAPGSTARRASVTRSSGS